ncbi:MAG: DUF3747 domain-containing protein [Cyanobium sp.]
MKRPYLALATLALVAGLSPTPSLLPRVWAEALFSSAPVAASSFAVLARPVGDDDWNLVVLEQLRARPFCWTPRPDGLVDPTLNRFNYTGICGRFIDSNGFSLRIQDTDLSHAYRLRLEQKGNEIQLFASSPSQATELLVGRGTVPRRDRDLFVALQLEPGWTLRRRVFGDRSLNHIYFSNADALDSLIAAARGRTAEPSPLVQAPPPLGNRRAQRSMAVVPTDSRQRFRIPSEPASPASPVAPAAQVGRFQEPAPIDSPGPGVITLQVIPYQERIDPQARSAQPVDPLAQAQGL